MHWIYPSIAGVFFGFGLGSISDAALTLVIDSYREVCSLGSNLLSYHLIRWN